MSGSTLIQKFGQLLTVTRYEESRQTQILEFDADFVIDNDINLDINGIAIDEVAYDTDQATTLSNLAESIENHSDILSAEVIELTRKIEIIQSDAGSEFLIENIIVSGGLSQANGSIISKTGGYIDGILQSGSITTFEAYISIQPLNGKEILYLPEGGRNRRYMKAYCATKLNPAQETLGIKGDLISYDDTTFEVMACEKWTPTSLNHYKLLLAEVSK